MNATTIDPAIRPRWYSIAAIAALLWNLLGVAMFLLHYTMSAEALAALPAEQQALFESLPAWTWVAYAVGTIGGALGAVLLVMRRRAARWLLTLSLAGVLAQFTWQAVLSEAVPLLGAAQALTLPLVVLVVAALICWFAWRADARGWLH